MIPRSSPMGYTSNPRTLKYPMKNPIDKTPHSSSTLKTNSLPKDNIRDIIKT